MNDGAVPRYGAGMVMRLRLRLLVLKKLPQAWRAVAYMVILRN